MLRIVDLSKTYGDQRLFENATFNLDAGERVGVVGRNGSGKTTLLRILLGRETPDTGEITAPKNYRLGHLDQHLTFARDTVLAEACRGLPPVRSHESWRAEKTLAGLGFPEAHFDLAPGQISGGFQVRLALAKALLAEPDCLLLDEPTNYLDIVSIRWLIRLLNAWRGEILLVTHDRGFMDAVATHILGIHRRRVRKLPGATDKYYRQIAQEEEIHEKTRVNEEKRRRQTEDFIRRFRAKARLAGLVQSRIKTLEKTQRREKLERVDSLAFSFPELDFPAKVMLEAHNLGFAYPGQERPLFDNLNLLIGRRERLAVIGRNGRGKTTLLRLLAGHLAPRTGSLTGHPRLRVNYYGQAGIDALQPDRTVEEELAAAEPNRNRQRARDVAGVMMFSGHAALKPVRVLSGGERARVLLGKLLLTPAHLLLLDEPTHHLDMESCQALAEALDAFSGSVVFVTHDEELLHTAAGRLLVFDRGRPRDFQNGYGDFLRDVGWDEERPAAAPSKSGRGRREDRRVRAARMREKSQVLRPLEQRVRNLEEAIGGAEQAQAEVEQKLVRAATAGDAPALADLARRRKDLEARIDAAYAELEDAAAERDAAAASFADSEPPAGAS